MEIETFRDAMKILVRAMDRLIDNSECNYSGFVNYDVLYDFCFIDKPLNIGFSDKWGDLANRYDVDEAELLLSDEEYNLAKTEEEKKRRLAKIKAQKLLYKKNIAEIEADITNIDKIFEQRRVAALIDLQSKLESSRQILKELEAENI